MPAGSGLQARSTRFLAGSSNDWKAGASPSHLRELLTYWRNRFVWCVQEDVLNRFRHFQGNVDGTQLHFFHEKGYGPRFFNVQRWTILPCGGHFAALEEPELLARDLCELFRSFRR